jgi:hypothetical protein
MPLTDKLIVVGDRFVRLYDDELELISDTPTGGFMENVGFTMLRYDEEREKLWAIAANEGYIVDVEPWTYDTLYEGPASIRGLAYLPSDEVLYGANNNFSRRSYDLSTQLAGTGESSGRVAFYGENAFYVDGSTGRGPIQRAALSDLASNNWTDPTWGNEADGDFLDFISILIGPDGSLYGGSTNWYPLVTKINPDAGGALWDSVLKGNKSTNQNVFAMAIDNDALYAVGSFPFPNDQGTLYKIDPSDGTVLLTAEGLVGDRLGLSVNESYVYVFENDVTFSNEYTTISKFSKEDLSLVWSRDVAMATGGGYGIVDLYAFPAGGSIPILRLVQRDDLLPAN